MWGRKKLGKSTATRAEAWHSIYAEAGNGDRKRKRNVNVSLAFISFAFSLLCFPACSVMSFGSSPVCSRFSLGFSALLAAVSPPVFVFAL